MLYVLVIIYITDIGANLTDEMYQGVYHGSKKHEPDLELVLKRAWEGGLTKMIITGTSLSDSKTALELAKTNSKYTEGYTFNWIQKKKKKKNWNYI